MSALYSPPVSPSGRSAAITGLELVLESGLTPAALAVTLESYCRGTSLRLAALDRLFSDATASDESWTARWRCLLAMTDDSDGAHPGVTDAEIGDLVRRIGAELRWLRVEKLNRAALRACA